MALYPVLTQEQQRGLPKLIEPVTQFRTRFSDSTHTVWLCETLNGRMVLKTCNLDTIASSPFWQGMNQLFACDFPASLERIALIHDFIASHIFLNVPDYIASQSSLFVMVSYLDGQEIEREQVSDYMVMQLARHLAGLHLLSQPEWGSIQGQHFHAELWPKKLHETLISLAKEQNIELEQALLKQVELELEQVDNSHFCPIMMDLRWDQMRHTQGQLSSVIDMDAFVFGPRELELVLLEYQLTEAQADRFATIYEDIADMPDLTKVRTSYRLLLFLMNSLGETDLNKWMNAPTWW